MLTIAIVLLMVGLVGIRIGNFLFIAEKKVIMNLIEWNFGLLLSGYYLLVWQAWLREGSVKDVAADA